MILLMWLHVNYYGTNFCQNVQYYYVDTNCVVILNLQPYKIPVQISQHLCRRQLLKWLPRTPASSFSHLCVVCSPWQWVKPCVLFPVNRIWQKWWDTTSNIRLKRLWHASCLHILFVASVYLIWSSQLSRYEVPLWRSPHVKRLWMTSCP